MLRIFLFLTFVACIASAKALSRPEISVPASVEVSQRTPLRLGDIVQVEQGDENLLATLDSILLSEQTTFSTQEILNLLKEQNIQAGFKIPHEVTIKKSSLPVSKKEVERRVGNILKGHCADCEFTINVQSAPYPLTAHWDLDFSQLTSKGSFLIPVHEEGQTGLKWISGVVRVRQLTPVATRFMAAGERVQTDDVKLDWVDTTFAKDASLKLNDLQGQQLSRSIALGQPVWASDVRREAAAKKGQMVKATLGSDGYEISTSLEAQDNGFVGDTIKVKNLETQKMLSALVLEKGLVKIQ